MKKEVIEKYNWLPVLELLVELVPWAANITGYFSYTWVGYFGGWLAGLAGLAGLGWTGLTR